MILEAKQTTKKNTGAILSISQDCFNRTGERFVECPVTYVVSATKLIAMSKDDLQIVCDNTGHKISEMIDMIIAENKEKMLNEILSNIQYYRNGQLITATIRYWDIQPVSKITYGSFHVKNDKLYLLRREAENGTIVIIAAEKDAFDIRMIK